MLISNCLMLLILATGRIKAEEERVWLEDVNNDHERRHLDLGLPETLEFNLKRSGGKSLRLTLTENKRLNANAPVYEIVSENGKQRMVQQAAVLILTTKFYHDKNMGAALKVTCNTRPFGACQRSLEGSLNIDGDTYELKPEPPVHVARSKASSVYVPHSIRKVSDSPLPETDQEGRGFLGADFKYINQEVKRVYNDGRPIPDDEDTRSYDDGKASDLLRSIIHLRELDSAAEKILSNTNHQKRETQLLAVEIVAVVDPILWRNYYAKTSANNGMNRKQATAFVIRQKLVHVINGVSLRYESIDDLDMYVTISSFLFYKTISKSNPLSPSVKTYVKKGIYYADSDVYLDNLVKWAQTLKGVSHDDHYMVFSGYELYYDGNTNNNDVMGVAYVGGACGKYRVSVQQDRDYFQLTSVATHELGHNLGMNHDGDGSSLKCSPKNKYIMAPFVASFSSGEKYSVNPWRFSSCSIAALKSYIGRGRCFTDVGHYYNKTEWELHNSKLPGEIYSLDQQCKLIRGDSSGHCSSQSRTTEEVCRTMLCAGDNRKCQNYAAARGTSCGQPSKNKWCIDGACVERPVEATTTQAPTTTTQPPTSTTNGQCSDIGWYDWSCERVSNYFYRVYGYRPSVWCQDPRWDKACCLYCKANKVPCVDNGWYGLSCKWISGYYLNTYGISLGKMCQQPHWKKNCCEYCKDRGY